MANENHKYGLRIFCIYFNDNSSSSKDTLEKIAVIGNPDIKKEGNTDQNAPHYYESNSLENLCKIFEEISRVVEKNYSLKFNEIQRQ